MRRYIGGFAASAGLYKIDIVIKDVNNPDHIGRWQRSDVGYDDDRLASSSLVLRAQWARAVGDIGAGNFVIGDTHIVPRVPPVFAGDLPSGAGELLDAGV